MKKLFLFLLVMALANAALADPPKVLPQGGSSFSTATVLPNDLYITSRRLAPGNFEFFKINVPADQLLTIQLSTFGKGTTSLAIFSYDRKKVAEEVINKDLNETKAIQLRSQLARQYYIRLGGDCVNCEKTIINMALNYEGPTFLTDEPIIVMQPAIKTNK